MEVGLAMTQFWMSAVGSEDTETEVDVDVVEAVSELVTRG